MNRQNIRQNPNQNYNQNNNQNQEQSSNQLQLSVQSRRALDLLKKARAEQIGIHDNRTKSNSKTTI